jgi:uncharacterized membrane protein (DUF373 family)
VEVSLVSALREVILQGVLEIPLNQLLGVCTFLSVLGGLLFLRAWMFQRLKSIDLKSVDLKSVDSIELWHESDRL